MIEHQIDWPSPGRYVLAISGGADSMVLLHLMAVAAESRGYDLIVAHFDHGLRLDSTQDCLFVEKAAQSHNLPFAFKAASLGQASEATARTARHEWLEQMRSERQADAVITAHHQDDLLETSLLNLARGSGRHGLAPMSPGAIKRPLIGISRVHLRAYASTNKITWREDSTNSDITNPRNYLRLELLAKASASWRSRYLELVTSLAKLNTKIDHSISVTRDNLSSGEMSYSFPRAYIREISLMQLEEHLVATALMLWPDVELDRRVVKEMALFAKTSAPRRYRPLRKNLLVAVQTDSVRVYYMGISKVGRR